MHAGHALGEQPLAQPGRVLHPDPADRGRVVLHRVQLGGQVGRERRAGQLADRSMPRTLVTGMMPAMIGTSQPSAATRSRIRR